MTPLFYFVIARSFKASVLIVAIFVVRFLLGNRLSPRLRHGLWFAVPLTLLFYVSIPSTVSVYNALPPQSEMPQLPYDWPYSQERSGVAMSLPALEVSETSTTQPAAQPEIVEAIFAPIAAKTTVRWTASNLFCVVWLAGCFAMVSVFMRQIFVCRRWIRKSVPVHDERILTIYREAYCQMNVSKPPRLAWSEEIRSPFLLGMVRPHLLLPSEMSKNSSEEQLQTVFLHELAHDKRRDVATSWLMSLLLIVHWFNVLLWLAIRRMNADREEACDLLALQTLDASQRPGYGNALVDIVRQSRRLPRLQTPGLVGISESGNNLKRRIEMIRRIGTWKLRWKILAASLLLLIVAGTITDRVVSKSKPEADGAENVKPKEKREYVPLEKLPQEPEAFLKEVQSLGEKFIAEADATLKKENLSKEERDSAIEKMKWGVKFKYGGDRSEYVEKMSDFLRRISDESRANHDYLPDFEWCRLLALEEKNLKFDEKDTLRTAFENLCEKYVNIRDKYHPRKSASYQSVFLRNVIERSLIGPVADIFDPDTTRGFVQYAAEKLGLDPDKSIENPEGPFTDEIYGTIRRTRLLGNELDISGVDIAENAIDLKQFRGKPVLIVAFESKMSDTTRNISNELYKLLHPEGFEMVKVQRDYAASTAAGMGMSPYSQDRPITAEEVAEFPGIIVKSIFYDSHHCWTSNFGLSNPYLYPGEEFCLFLIDSQGKVVRLQNNGFDAALCAKLKKMFPAKAKEISALQTTIQANQDRWDAEKNNRNVFLAARDKPSPEKELLTLFEICDDGMNNPFNNYTYQAIRTHQDANAYWKRVFPFFIDFPDFTDVSPEIRFRILLTKTKARWMELAFQMDCDPSLRPEVVCKPLCDEILQWKKDYPNHPFQYDFYSIRRDTVRWLMMEHLKNLPPAEKKAYAEVVIRELVQLAKEELPTANPKTDSVGQDFRIIVPETLKEFESIDDGLSEKLKSQLSTIIFATTKDETLLDFAAKELR